MGASLLNPESGLEQEEDFSDVGALEDNLRVIMRLMLNLNLSDADSHFWQQTAIYGAVTALRIHCSEQLLQRTMRAFLTVAEDPIAREQWFSRPTVAIQLFGVEGAGVAGLEPEFRLLRALEIAAAKDDEDQEDDIEVTDDDPMKKELLMDGNLWTGSVQEFIEPEKLSSDAIEKLRSMPAGYTMVLGKPPDLPCKGFVPRRLTLDCIVSLDVLHDPAFNDFLIIGNATMLNCARCSVYVDSSEADIAWPTARFFLVKKGVDAHEIFQRVVRRNLEMSVHLLRRAPTSTHLEWLASSGSTHNLCKYVSGGLSNRMLALKSRRPNHTVASLLLRGPSRVEVNGEGSSQVLLEAARFARQHMDFSWVICVDFLAFRPILHMIRDFPLTPAAARSLAERMVEVSAGAVDPLASDVLHAALWETGDALLLLTGLEEMTQAIGVALAVIAALDASPAGKKLTLWWSALLAGFASAPCEKTRWEAGPPDAARFRIEPLSADERARVKADESLLKLDPIEDPQALAQEYTRGRRTLDRPLRRSLPPELAEKQSRLVMTQEWVDGQRF